MSDTTFNADPMRGIREQAERDKLILSDLKAEAERWDAEAAQRAAALHQSVNAAMDTVEAAIRPPADPFDVMAAKITRWDRIWFRVWYFLYAPEGPGISKDADAGDFMTTRWDRIKWRLWDRPKGRYQSRAWARAAAKRRAVQEE